MANEQEPLGPEMAGPPMIVPMPVPIGIAIATQPRPGDGKMVVRLEISSVTGEFVFFVDGPGARTLAGWLTDAARKAESGLIIADGRVLRKPRDPEQN